MAMEREAQKRDVTQIQTKGGVMDDGVTRSERYNTFCRPLTGSKLHAANLDVQYHRGEGSWLYYSPQTPTRGQHEIKVADFAGGYGSLLFGHNHPALIAEMQACLQTGNPMLVQGSVRGAAADLCAELDKWAHAETTQHYVTALVNSGTEAVEAALKHAELARQLKVRAWLEKERLNITELLAHATSTDIAALTLHSAINVPRGDKRDVSASLLHHLQTAASTPPVMVAREQAFHGKSTGAVQLTHNPEFRAPFVGLGCDVHFLSGQAEAVSADLDQLAVQVPVLRRSSSNEKLFLDHVNLSRVAAIFLEPIQGEAGIRALAEDFLIACRAAADALRVPLVFDEIQSGMGRTGTFFASTASGVRGDYYLLGKSLGGGLTKLAACMIERNQYISDFDMLHTSTFAEDELSARVASRALTLLREDQVLATAREKGLALKQALLDLQQEHSDVVDDVRGRGLMLGIQFKAPVDSPSDLLRGLANQPLLGYAFAAYLLHRHQVRVLPSLSAPLVLRIQPDYRVTDDAIKQLLSGLSTLAELIQRGDFYALTAHLVDRVPNNNRRVSHRPRVRQPIHDVAAHAGFVAHFIEADHVRLRDHSLIDLPAPECANYLDRVVDVLDPACYEQSLIESATGDRIGFTFVGTPQTSAQIAARLMQRDLQPLRQIVQRGVDLAAAEGCQVIGLGGFSSIITNNCRSLNQDGFALTSGNSFTVAMAFEAMQRQARARGIEISRARLATLGAAGNIGQVFCELAAERVASITLIGRDGGNSLKRLTNVAAMICEQSLTRIKNTSSTELRGVARTIARCMHWCPANVPVHLDGAELFELLDRKVC